MAANTRATVVDIHNNMVLELSNYMEDEDFNQLKLLFNNNPLTPVHMRSINSVGNLFTILMSKKVISYGNYATLVRKLEPINPSLCDIIQKCTEDIAKETEDKPDTSSTQGAQPRIDAANTQEQQDTAKKTKIKEIHAEMITSLSTWINPKLPTDWRNFQTLMDAHLSNVEVFGKDVTCLDDICRALLGKGIIAYGKYDKLRSAVVKIHVEAANIVDDATSKISAI
ncbi:uncharacterized protein LOC117322499 [Pecten maximus]|uniref:uncharacterized protein LOC117322499 n=1 Tax=Pecten maximus TaxID=6579 RepID=UPI0014586FB7|nr:uncharacterized protein LOC117322499 [Pecten maximus]